MTMPAMVLDSDANTVTLRANEDGSVTLTKNEWRSLRTNFERLYDIVNGGVASFEDFFHSRQAVIEIRLWKEILLYGEFDGDGWEYEPDELEAALPQHKGVDY